MSCETLEEDRRIVDETIKETFVHWSKAIKRREAQINEVVTEWNRVRDTIEGILGDKGAEMQSMARDRLGRFLTAKDNVRLAHLTHKITKEVEASIKTNKDYQALIALADKRRASADSMKRSLKAHDGWFRAAPDTDMVNENKRETEFRISVEEDLRLKHLKDAKQMIERIINSRIQQEQIHMVRRKLSRLSRQDEDFQEYRSQLQVQTTDLMGMMDQFGKELNEIRGEFAKEQSRWEDMLDRSSKEIQQECDRAKSMVQRLIRQTDDNFQQRFDLRSTVYKIPPPPDYRIAESACKKEDKITPSQYQQLVADLMNRRKGFDVNGLLIFHDMGTGKTCSISMIVASFYDYYLNEDRGQLPEAQIPCALIFVQNKTALTNFATTAARGCSTYKEKEVKWKNIPLKYDTYADGKTKKVDTMMYVLYAPGEGKTAPVLRVVTHWMRNYVHKDVEKIFRDAIRAFPTAEDYCGNTVNLAEIHASRHLLPHRGVVVYDEAHNAFDAEDIKGNLGDPQSIPVVLNQLLQRRDLPVVMSSGTPARNTKLFGNLVKLLDVVRRACTTQLMLDPTGKYDTETLNHVYFTKVESNRTAYYTSGEAVDAADDEGTMEEVHEWEWKKGMKEKFASLVGKYVSFITLENDPTRYPRTVVRFLPQYPTRIKGGYEVHVTFPPDYDAREYKTDQNGVVTPLPKLVFSEPTPIADTLLILHVPTHPDQWNHMNSRSIKGSRVGFSMTRATSWPAIPNKWRVLEHMLMTYSPKETKTKHFVFHPAGGAKAEIYSFRSSTAGFGFLHFLANGPLKCKEIAYPAKIFRELQAEIDAKFDAFQSKTPPDERDAQSVVMKERVDAWYAMIGKPPTHPYCAMLRDGGSSEAYSTLRDNAVILAIYNDRRNKDGEYIGILFANMPHKEGIDVKHTGFVHVVEPLSSKSQLRQVKARIERNCSWEDEPDVRKWMTTTIVYVATPPHATMVAAPPRRRVIRKREDEYDVEGPATYEMGYIKDKTSGTPVELALELMEKAALDCQIFSAYMNRGQCYLHTLPGYSSEEAMLAMTQGFCFDPVNGNMVDGQFHPPVITFVRDGKGIKSVADCYARHMVPGKMLVYDEDDAFLYALLTRYGYTPKALSNIKLLDQFSDMVTRRTIHYLDMAPDKPQKAPKTGAETRPQASSILSRLLDVTTIGVYKKTLADTSYRLTLSHDIKPIDLVRWIRYNPPEIGNAVVFLLQQKRQAAGIKTAAAMDASVANQVKAFKKIEDRRLEVREMTESVFDRIETMQAGIEKRLASALTLIRNLKTRWKGWE